MGRGKQPPRTLEEFYRRLRPATAALGGCRSWLRSVTDEAALESGILAALDMPEGELQLRPATARRLRRLIEGPDIRTPGLRRQLVTDLLTVLHECLHSLGPDRAAEMRAAVRSSTRASRVFEEGLVEWTAQRMLPSFLEVTGLGPLAPWLRLGTPVPAYDAVTAAAGTLVIAAAQRHGTAALEEARGLLALGVGEAGLDRMAQRLAGPAGATALREQIVALFIELGGVGSHSALDGASKALRVLAGAPLSVPPVPEPPALAA